MADVLPQNFPVPSESAIASYNYTDIAEGTGITKFYCCTTKDSAGTGYIMTTNPLFSNDIELTTGSPFTFDLQPFNMPKIIGGTGLINFTFNNTVGTFTSTINIQKWDGTTATTIGTVNSKTIGVAKEIICEAVTITKTAFKIGEILRLRLNVTAGGAYYFGTDPQNRDGVGITPSADGLPSKFEFFCPFKLDL